MDGKLTEILGEENKPILELFRFITYGVFIMLSIDADVIRILQILMMLDMGFGIIKAIRLGIKVRISTMLWGFVIKTSLLVIPCVVALMGQALGKDFIWMLDVSVKALVVNEGLSILSNILSIKENKNIQNFDFISLLVEGLRDFLINKFKSFLNGKQ